MGNEKYTDPQRYAINEDCGNLLVSAAAGSGKTFTLSEHIVKLVKDGHASIDEMLVVTFTRSAAADMKRKIGERLRKAANEVRSSDPKAYDRLARSASKVQSADISTIDSCLYKILRRYFSELGLPQDARLVSNNAVINRMKAEVMRDTVNELFDEGSDDFIYLADVISTVRETDRIDIELFELATHLSTAGLGTDDLLAFADSLEKTDFLPETILLTEFGKQIAKPIGRMLEHYAGVFGYYEDEFAFYTEVGEKFSGDCRMILDWLESARKTLDEGNIDKVISTLSGLAMPTIPRIGKAKCEFSEDYHKHRNDFKGDVKGALGTLATFSSDELLVSKDNTIRVMRCLAKALDAYYKGYAKKKLALSMLDFRDLEKYAVKLLTDEQGEPTQAAREIGGKYKYVFIDEYQDTNRKQDMIFRSLSVGARRFMVGDIKQAIYRFRGADPSVFAGYRRKWAEVDPKTEGGYDFSLDDGRVLLMSDNFRSTEPVTQLTNAVSDYLMPHGGIPYSSGDGLICSKDGGKDELWPNAEVVLLEKVKNKDENGKDKKETPEEAEKPKEDEEDIEIGYVADRIASMLGTYLGDKEIKPSDIAILSRNKTNFTKYTEALLKRGIPAFCEKETPLEMSPSVLLLVSVMNFVDNPMRDVYAAGALRSPVFGFSMEDLIKLRGYAGKLPIYMGVLACAEDGDADGCLREKCVYAAKWIEREKTVSKGMSPTKYLEYLIEATDVFSIDGVRENGMERDAINKLCVIAQEFESSAGSPVERDDLSSFLEYAEEALGETGGSDSKPAKPSGNAVSIMSIHKSKGLQFPVVFVVGCGGFLDNKDADKTVVFDKHLGIGMWLPDVTGFAKCDTFFRRAVSERLVEEGLNEEMRILYVALSRSETKLIVTAKPRSFIVNMMNAAEKDAHFGDDYYLRNNRSYISWIIGALSVNKPPRVEIVPCYIGGEQTKDGAAEIRDDTAAEENAPLEIADIDERCSFEYPYAFLSALPSKLTVSKLSPEILDDGESGEAVTDVSTALDGTTAPTAPQPKTVELKKPVFMTGEKYASASEKGTATHVFMQFADFGRLHENGVRSEMERLIADRFISRAQAEIVSVKQIERFAESSLMDKLLRSPFVKREFRFNIRMDAREFTKDESLAAKLGEYGEKVTVQGVVDCVFRDPDTNELTLIDYKTDSFTDEERHDARLAEKLMRDRHTNQLTYYKRICSDMFGEEIPHAYVYSTVLGRLIEV